MPRKNLLGLHEAVAVALLDKPNWEASFDEIAAFIVDRNLCPNRDGGLPLATQIMRRATKSKGSYVKFFEQTGEDRIRLRNKNTANK
jgi:hypothetical protein